MANLELAKRIVKENYEDAECGLFFTRNLIGDPMTTLLDGDDLQIDICYEYMYFEVFGLNVDEQKELEKYYDSLGKEKQ